MRITVSETSKQIYHKDILRVLENNYSIIGPIWLQHQMDWKNSNYASYKDHDKFLIIIYLIKKTLDVYSKNFVNLSYDQLYSQDSVKVEKFNVIEIARNNNIPKEIPKVIDLSISSKVDINQLIAKAREKERKENKLNYILLSIAGSIILSIALTLSL